MNSPDRPSDPKRQRASRSEQENPAAEEGEDLFRDTVSPLGAAEPEEEGDLFRDSLPPPGEALEAQDHNPAEEVDLFRDSLPPESALDAEEEDEDAADGLWNESLPPQSKPAQTVEEMEGLWKESAAPQKKSPFHSEEEDLFKDSVPPGSKVFPRTEEEMEGLWTESMPPKSSAADTSEELFKESLPPEAQGDAPDPGEIDALWTESMPPKSSATETSEELFKESVSPADAEASKELFKDSVAPQQREASHEVRELWEESLPPRGSGAVPQAKEEISDTQAEVSGSSRDPALDMSGLFEPDTGEDSASPIHQQRPYSGEEPSEEPSSLWKQSVPSMADPNMIQAPPKAERRVPVQGQPGAEPGLDKKISGLWGTIARPGTHERQSLSYAGPAKSTPEPSLVVKIRSLDKPVQGDVPDEQAPDFEIHKKLGEGGMGVVYLARQTCVDRQLAVKMLKPDQAADPSTRTRFLAEAAVTGELDHPNIVPIHEVARTDKDSLFYAMKRVVGQPWEEVLPKKEIGENLEIWMRMADAVAFAHDRGVIHRDLKPENVMLGDYGEVLLMDWGLAISTTGEGKAAQADPQESAGGTPAYLSPETARGTPEQFKITSDIYLLGAILYEIVTGYPPHTGASVIDCLMAAARNEIRKTDKKDELIDIALIAMATKPKDRYQSVSEMQQAVREYLDHRESVVLSKRAQQHLQNALESGKYDDFSQAIFGYREALSMWRDNDGARYGLAEATLAYAEAAYEKDDFDLAISLLEADNEEHQGLLFRAKQAQEERLNRQAQLKVAQGIMVILAVTIMLGLSIGTIVANTYRSQAETQRDQAIASRAEAEKARQLAEDEQQAAIQAQQEAELQRQRAEAQREAAEAAKQEAEKSKQEAEKETERAELARKDTEEARQTAQTQQKAAELAKIETSKQAYYAQIGLADAQIRFNAYARSAQLIAASNPPQRHWEWGYLNFLCNQHRQIYVGHEQPIEDLAISPNGSTVATVAQDGFGFLYHRESGEQLAKLEFPERPIGLSTAFSPDGSVLAVGTANGKLLLWDTKTWKLQHEIDAHVDPRTAEGFPIAALAFAPVESWVATGSSDNFNAIRFWDYRTGKRFDRFDTNRTLEGRVRSLQFSQDGSKLLAAGEGGMAVVWSDLNRPAVQRGRLKGGTPLRMSSNEIRAHRSEIHAAIFSPDAKQVLTAGESGTIKVWDLNASGSPKVTQTYEEHNGRINDLAISPDGRYLLSGGNDNSVIVWDLARKTLWKRLRGHGGWVRAVAWVPTKDRSLLALSGSNDTQAKLWDVQSYRDNVKFEAPQGEPLVQGELGLRQVCLTTSAKNQVHVWQRDTGQRFATLNEATQGQILALRSTPQGRLLLVTAEGGQAWIWDWQTEELLGRFEHKAPVVKADLSPDGKQLVVGTTEEIVYWKYLEANQAWRVASVNTIQLNPEEIIFSRGAKQWLLRFPEQQYQPCWIYYDNPNQDLLSFPNKQQPPSPISGMEFLGNQNFVVTVYHDGTLTVWDAITANSLATQATRQNRAKTQALALSADGKLALTGDSRGLVQVWQINQQGKQFTFQKQASFPAPNGSTPAVYSLAVAPDGSEAAVVYTDRQIQFLDLKQNKATGSETLIQGSDRVVPQIEYLPDGRLVTRTQDDILVWNLVSGIHFQAEQEIAPLSRYSGGVLATFSEDALRVITVGSVNHLCRIWDWQKEKLLAEFPLNTSAGRFRSLELSEDGKHILLADDTGNATLWQLAGNSAKLQKTFQSGSNAGLNAAVFSPHGQWVAAAGEDGYLWSVDHPEQPAARLPGHTQALSSIGFADNLSRIVTGGAGGEIRLWAFPKELPAGKTAELTPERTIAAHPGNTVNAVILSEDGQRAFTASNDHTAKVWDTSNGRELITLRGHKAPVTAVMLSGIQTTLVTVSRDGTARIWKATAWDNNELEGAVAAGR